MNFREFCLAHNLTLLQLGDVYHAVPTDLYHKESPTVDTSKEKSSMQTWAEQEVEIACKREKDNASNGEWDYGIACYESALRAFNSLMKDGHSGCSIGITKSILNRLIDGKPLTPIEDTPDMWNSLSRFGGDDKQSTSYQCKRMSSLFKYIYADGSVKYRDIDSNYCVNINNPDATYHSGLVQRIMDEMFPVKMPYMPGKPIKVYCEDFLTDTKNGDFDTVGVLYAITPDDKRVDINRFFKESDAGPYGMKEIGLDEYNERKAVKIS